MTTANPDLDEPMTATQAETYSLASEYVMLTASVERITERLGAIRARLAELHPTVGDYPAGPYRVRVKPGQQRLDPAKVLAKYPPAEHPELYTHVPVAAKVRELVAPILLGELTKPAKPSLVIE